MATNFTVSDQVVVKTPSGRNTSRMDIGNISSIQGSTATVKLAQGGRTVTVPLTQLTSVQSQYGQRSIVPNAAMRGNRIYLRK